MVKKNNPTNPINHREKELYPSIRAILREKDQVAILATIAENERPVHGLAGEIDWIFRGAISQFLRSGAFEGNDGELIYLPVTMRGRVSHLFLLGRGSSGKPGERRPLAEAKLAPVIDQLKKVGLTEIHASLRDLGYDEPDQADKLLNEVNLCLVH